MVAASPKPVTTPILMVPPSGRRPLTGGERNMVFLINALHEAGLSLGALTRPGPVTKAIDASVPIFALAKNPPLSLWRFYRKHRAKLKQSKTSLARYQALARLLNAYWEVYGDRHQAPLHPVTRSKSEFGVETFRGGKPALSEDFFIFFHAFRFRAAISSLKPKVLFCDHSVDAFCAKIACGNEPTQVVWYCQISEPDARYDGAVIELADHVVACGNEVGRLRIGDRRPFHTIRNGIDVDRFNTSRSHIENRASAPVHIGFVGSLIPRKGCFDFIQAVGPYLRSHPESRATLYGRGNRTVVAQLRKLAADQQVAHQIRFEGYVQDMPAAYRDMSLLVFPSRAEGLPLTILEAMACGVPCVAYDIAEVREISSDWNILVPCGNISLLESSVNAILSEPPTRARIGTAALEYVRNNFSHQQMVTKFKSLLLSILH